jgi:hypothetical protein
VEEFEKVLTGLADPLGGNLAGGAGRGHGALLSAQDSAILPQRTPLANSATPHITTLTVQRMCYSISIAKRLSY